jgi:hypothetical protein
LILVTAFDHHSSRRWRSCGKICIDSLLRHQWNGKIVVMRNFPQPLFPVERASLVEEEDVPKEWVQYTRNPDWRQLSRHALLKSASKLPQHDLCSWIVFSDADCVALRSIDHLFVGDTDLIVSNADGRPDPGFFAVRGNVLMRFIEAISAHGGISETNLEKLVNSGKWSCREFERGEVVRPFERGVSIPHLLDAALVHLSGFEEADKHRFAFALHFMSVYCDPNGLFLDMMNA